MKRIVMISAAFLALAACKSPCEQAEKAFDACVEESGVSFEGSEEDSEEDTCSDAKDEDDDLYDCIADAFGDADCSTEEGFVEAATVAAECSGESLDDSGM